MSHDEDLRFQVQTRGARGWAYCADVSDCPHFRLRGTPQENATFRSAYDAELAREWLIEERDYPAAEVRVQPGMWDDEMDGRFVALPDPRPRSGEHENPRRKLSATPEQWARMDAAAKRAGLPWTEWARPVLMREAKG